MPPPDTQPKVVVVDDDPLVLRMISRWLERRGYATHTTVSSSEARRLVHEQDPALVITDLHLQGESALALVDELQQTRTIVMSGNISALPTTSRRDNLVALGKPFTPATLDKMMLELLESDGQRDG